MVFGFFLLYRSQWETPAVSVKQNVSIGYWREIVGNTYVHVAHQVLRNIM